MRIADEESGLEFLDFKIKYVNGKLFIDVYSRPTNSFTYVMLSTCYRIKKQKMPQGISLRLRGIDDKTEEYD